MLPLHTWAREAYKMPTSPSSGALFKKGNPNGRKEGMSSSMQVAEDEW